MSAVMHPFLVSTDVMDSPEELRRRMRRDGYLFLPGLLPPDRVLHLRRRILDICARHGWLTPGTDPMEARDAMARCHEIERARSRVHSTYARGKAIGCRARNRPNCGNNGSGQS